MRLPVEPRPRFLTAEMLPLRPKATHASLRLACTPDAPASGIAGEHVRMVEQAVQAGGDDGGIAEQLTSP